MWGQDEVCGQTLLLLLLLWVTVKGDKWGDNQPKAEGSICGGRGDRV